MFFISKCAISISFSVTYVYTTELFPTNLRQGLMGICAACGYIGSMTAPQTPLLVSTTYYNRLGLYEYNSKLFSQQKSEKHL